MSKAEAAQRSRIFPPRQRQTRRVRRYAGSRSRWLRPRDQAPPRVRRQAQAIHGEHFHRHRAALPVREHPEDDLRLALPLVAPVPDAPEDNCGLQNGSRARRRAPACLPTDAVPPGPTRLPLAAATAAGPWPHKSVFVHAFQPQHLGERRVPRLRRQRPRHRRLRAWLQHAAEPGHDPVEFSIFRGAEAGTRFSRPSPLVTRAPSTASGLKLARRKWSRFSGSRTAFMATNLCSGTSFNALRPRGSWLRASARAGFRGP